MVEETSFVTDPDSRVEGSPGTCMTWTMCHRGPGEGIELSSRFYSQQSNQSGMGWTFRIGTLGI